MNRQPDMRQLMKQDQQMQAQLAMAQAELAQKTFVGSAGGGMVTATVTGAQALVGITISPDVVDPEDIELLEDLVLAAVRQGFDAAAPPAAGERARAHRGSRPRRPARLMFEGPVQRLLDELARLPGIGQKTAQRLAFHLFAVEEADARRRASPIVYMRGEVSRCTRCVAC